MFLLEEILANYLLLELTEPNYLTHFHLFVLKARRIIERFLQENKYVLANGCL
jgi:hypothetical protein